MKYSLIIVSTITLFAAFALSSCDSSSDKMNNTENTTMDADRDMELAQTEVDNELRMYRSEHEDQVLEYNRTISEIKEEIENESDEEVREELEEKLENYEEELDELKSEMDNYKASGRDNWNDFKGNFTNKMDDLGDSLDNFFSPNTTTSRN